MFDYPRFRRAFEARDLETWIDFYAEDADWIEYRHNQPPRSPRVHAGRADIAEHLKRVKASDITIELTNEVVGADRIAFQVWVHLPGDRRIIEHVIVELRDGKIVRQTDVEAWDL